MLNILSLKLPKPPHNIELEDSSELTHLPTNPILRSILIARKKYDSIDNELIEAIEEFSRLTPSHTSSRASEFIELHLETIIKPEHKDYLPRIKQCIQTNHKVLKRDLDPSPLNWTDREYFKDLLCKCYGGVVSNQAKTPLLDSIKELAISFYSQSENSGVKLGCFITVFKDRVIKEKEELSLNINKAMHISYITIFRYLKNIVPSLAIAKGRSKKGMTDNLSTFMSSIT
ncbi:hypothetical protein [Aliivibrio fischeri]|uniref:hypothetical protein n=1 Tax=Aliivibrio fischeri TaxID=668 RepID=UPI0011125504|nr:hypothetical protein [Aliivibrio fischeri]